MTWEKIDKLYTQRDKCPASALAMLPDLGDSQEEIEAKAVVLIDCGDAIQCFDSVSRGVKIFEGLVKSAPNSAELAYNLANGFQVRARLVHGPSSPYRGQTCNDRFQSRVQFGNIMRISTASSELKSQASTNIGILLIETNRWIEAIDYFQHALALLPQNGVAAFQEMRRLMGLAGLFATKSKTYQSYCHFDTLLARIVQLAQIVQSNYNIVEEFAGSNAVPVAKRTVADVLKISVTPQSEPQEPYFEFLQKNHLALSLHCSAEEYASSRFDLLSIPSIHRDPNAGHEVPEIFAMMNVMKADFAFARQILYDARSSVECTSFIETTSHSDTLDYSVYGVRYSALTNAQRIAFDILDKISVALACYFEMPKGHLVSFTNIWGKKVKGGKFQFSE